MVEIACHLADVGFKFRSQLYKPLPLRLQPGDGVPAFNGEVVMAEWGYWVMGAAVVLLLFDTHKRVSVAMDAVLRMEERLNQMRVKE